MGLYISTKTMQKWHILLKAYKISTRIIEFNHDLSKNMCYVGVIYYLLNCNFDGSNDSMLAQ